MNELFVNIKVDREERPDLDQIYQIAQQMLTRRCGGWPLTMFLTPDEQRPFFGGTYFPKEARYGLPAFRDLLRQRAPRYYREHRDELREQNAALMAARSTSSIRRAGADALTLTDAPLRPCRARARSAPSTPQYGGFGARPKFPHPHELDRLLRDWHASARQTSRTCRRCTWRRSR